MLLWNWEATGLTCKSCSSIPNSVIALTRPRHHLTNSCQGTAGLQWLAHFLSLNGWWREKAERLPKRGLKNWKNQGKLPKLHLPWQEISLPGKQESIGDSFQALHLIDRNTDVKHATAAKGSSPTNKAAVHLGEEYTLTTAVCPSQGHKWAQKKTDSK